LGVVVLIGSLAFLLVCLVGLIAAGSAQGFWGTAFAVSFLGVIIGFAYYGLTRVLLSVEANTFHSEETMHRLLRRYDDVVEKLNALNENMLLSDGAKALAFRDKDFQALRQAIEEEINHRDWEAALYLADQMESRFGYHQEAQKYRKQVQQIQDGEMRKILDMALAKFEDCLTAYDWDGARMRIEEIRAQFPNSPEAETLQDKLEFAWTARKKWLVQQWDETVQKNEVDRGIETLKELDNYLSKSEVAAFEESARGVFKAKLHNLGVQFSLLVAEKVWDRALDVANEIVSEFPNSRMAQEIGERLATLKSKASGMKGN